MDDTDCCEVCSAAPADTGSRVCESCSEDIDDGSQFLWPAGFVMRAAYGGVSP